MEVEPRHQPGIAPAGVDCRDDFVLTAAACTFRRRACAV